MRTPHLILREIAHRKVNALLMLLGVVAAVGCLIAAVTLLRWHDGQTDARTQELTDDYRKIVLTLGFNVFIVPKESQGGRVDADMPQQYVDSLANADIITIDHLLPSLSADLFWQERKTQVTLTGIHGEVAIAGKKRKRPLIQPVEKDQIVLGHKIAEKTKLKKGEKTELLGQTFTVSKVHEFRGTADDYTAWIDLSQAQQLLNKPGRITAIQAINCLAPNCHPDATGIPTVTQEIARVLPATDVIIDMGKARTRIDARTRAATESQAAKAQAERIAAILVPLVIVAAAVWIGLLALTNVRDRRAEIGVLRALGVRSRGILTLFLGKAIAIGLIGAVIGYAAGLGAGSGLVGASVADLIDPIAALAVLIAAPLIAALAAWLPAMIAAQQDPAAVLCQE